MGYQSTISAMLIALVGSILIGRNAAIVGESLGLVDSPDELGGRKQHLHPTPLVGGMAVCLAAVVAALVAIGWNLFAPTPLPGMTNLLAFSCAVVSMLMIGMADDRHTLSPRTRLAGSILILLVVLSSVPAYTLEDLHFTGNINFSLGSMGVIFTLVCLVGLLNAVNMADGKNGLVISLCLIWCAVLAAHTSGLWLPVLGAMAVSLTIMLWFNFRGKLFLGDGGSYGLSAAFGLMAINLHITNPIQFAADQVALLFAVPVFDTMRLMLIRAARGASPFVGDSDHLHHHLARRWGWPAGLYIYCLLVGLTNLASVLYPDFSIYVLVGTAIAYALVISISHAPESDAILVPASNISLIGSGTRHRSKGSISRQINEDAA